MCRAIAFVALAGTLALGACAVAPPGPSVAAMPPQGKNLAEFQQDDATCRQYAAQQVGISPAEASQQSAVNSAALGTVLGAAAGAAIGAAAGNPAIGAAIGAGSGLVMGSAAGANAAAISGAGVQQRYDIGYAQCMASKGDSVPAVTASRIGYPYPSYPNPYPNPYAYPYAAYPPPYYPYPPMAYYGSGYVGFGWGWHRWR
ncbi:MAG TPA: glycine zipper family protein [Stellaceae bacterium]|nr:glycine zipper family protein [Stellaceae bacterium]